LHKAFVIVPLLGWTGVAALVHYARVPLPFPSEHNEGTVVVVATRHGEAGHRIPVAQAPRRIMPRPSNRAALVRELQKELTRVGCYDGKISGVWTTSSRRAMRAFTRRVNAKLPTGKPDLILLSLVQGHRKKVCGVACPAGRKEDAAGRCVPEAIARAANKEPAGPGVGADPPAQTPQISIGSTAAAAAVAARLREPEAGTPPPSAKRSHAQPHSADAKRLRSSTAKKRARKRRKIVRRRAKPRPPSPPAVVQSLIRNVKSALGIY